MEEKPAPLKTARVRHPNRLVPSHCTSYKSRFTNHESFTPFPLSISLSNRRVNVARPGRSRHTSGTRQPSRVDCGKAAAFHSPLPMATNSTPRTDPPAESNSTQLDRDRLTQRERAVWRAAMVLLGVLAVGLAITSW